MAFTDMMLGFGILGALFGLIMFGISIFSLIFWILMILDCVKRRFKDDSEKIVWILVVIFAGIIGALIYYFIVKRKKR